MHAQLQKWSGSTHHGAGWHSAAGRCQGPHVELWGLRTARHGVRRCSGPLQRAATCTRLACFRRCQCDVDLTCGQQQLLAAPLWPPAAGRDCIWGQAARRSHASGRGLPWSHAVQKKASSSLNSSRPTTSSLRAMVIASTWKTAAWSPSASRSANSCAPGGLVSQQSHGCLQSSQTSRAHSKSLLWHLSPWLQECSQLQ